MNYYFVTNTEF